LRGRVAVEASVEETVVGVVEEWWRWSASSTKGGGGPSRLAKGIERKGGGDPSQREESERGRMPTSRRRWLASSTKGGGGRR
jgi:hypothetical protein